MTFDPIHDSQAVHRALVLAFSFPGTPVPVEPALRTGDLGLPPVLAAVALTLLDPETSYSSELPSPLTEVTGAKRRPGSEAAFLLVPVPGDPWGTAFATARRGTLADPHLGATVVAFAPADGALTLWRASGPGLEHPVDLALPAGTWVEKRNAACVEFPLGVDLIWAQDDAVVALPRTTRLLPGKGD
jgi:phosphonate C-P lyase system protein PhnH